MGKRLLLIGLLVLATLLAAAPQSPETMSVDEFRGLSDQEKTRVLKQMYSAATEIYRTVQEQKKLAEGIQGIESARADYEKLVAGTAKNEAVLKTTWERIATLAAEDLRARPRDFDALMVQAHVFRHLSQWKLSAESFQKAIAVRPDSAHAHFQLALVYLATDQPQVVDEYAVLQKLDPELAKKLYALKPEAFTAKMPPPSDQR